MLPKNYAYRMNCDRNFAPHIENDICILSGCKKTTIEKWANEGSWVIGIGGNNTGKPNKLIYAMKVEEKLKYPEFKKLYPNKSNYLQKEEAGDNVLLSRRFYYFGDEAIDLPEKKFNGIIVDRQGCKRIENIDTLEEYIKGCGFESIGKLGEPNNSKLGCLTKKCKTE